MEELNPKRPSLQKTKRNAPSVAAVCVWSCYPDAWLAKAALLAGNFGIRLGRCPDSACPPARARSPAVFRKGKAHPGSVATYFQDAIDLGLKNNLRRLLQSYHTIAARGEKWKELSALLPM